MAKYFKIIITIFILFGEIFLWKKGYTINPTKTKIRTSSEINLFCSKIQPENNYCEKWWDTQKKLLELKSHLYLSIKKYCESQPKDPFCQMKNKTDINTYCNKIKPEDEICKQWQILKQMELETKGFLSEEIKIFCLQNPTHPFCKPTK